MTRAKTAEFHISWVQGHQIWSDSSQYQTYKSARLSFGSMIQSPSSSKESLGRLGFETGLKQVATPRHPECHHDFLGKPSSQGLLARYRLILKENPLPTPHLFQAQVSTILQKHLLNNPPPSSPTAPVRVLRSLVHKIDES